MSEEQFEEAVKNAEKLTGISKISEILHAGKVLSKNIEDSKYFDKLHDMSNENTEWFNRIYITIKHITSTDHYKECRCPAEKYDDLIFSNSKGEFVEKTLHRLLFTHM
ncbi:MAG: hypothetical protein V4538_16160 [Bacteroidota bacterium]